MSVGEIDLEMLSKLRLKHPGVLVDNEVVEPSSQQLHNYKGTSFNGTHHHILQPICLGLYIVCTSDCRGMLEANKEHAACIM